jgi:hypothetical protein
MAAVNKFYFLFQKKNRARQKILQRCVAIPKKIRVADTATLPQIEKAARIGRPFQFLPSVKSSRLLRRGLFGFDPCGLAFDVTRAAFAFDDFVGLSSHNSLLCLRVAVLCCHYESLRAAIQCLFRTGGGARAALRLPDGKA